MPSGSAFIPHPSSLIPAFAAVLLAGGRSHRMGRDKALLPLPGGQLLWQRQLAVLRALEPAELFISGPAREGFPPDVPLLADETPGLGPLGGIAAALAAMHSPRLVVLAVDLPAMTAEFLRGLLPLGSEASAVVPLHLDSSFYEPLAAVYPRGCLALARVRLENPDRSLQSFVQAIDEVHSHWITLDEEPLFANWNEPIPG